MPINQTIKLWAILVFLLALALFLGKNLGSIPPPVSLGLSVAFPVLFITFFFPESGLYLVILSMLLSPEFTVASLPGRDVVVRLEDILLTIVIFTWLSRTAIIKEMSLFKRNPLNLPIVLYISAGLLATLVGVILGNVNLTKGLFFVFKTVEYFLFFFMAANLLHSKPQAQRYFTLFLIVCLMVAVYGIFSYQAMGRASAPFEGKIGEPNTLGGYLLLMFSVAFGVFLYSKNLRIQVLLGVLIFAIIPSFLLTLSRASYLAFPFTLLTFYLCRERRGLLTGVIAGIFLLVIFAGMPAKINERIKYTFQPDVGSPTARIGRISFDPSTSERLLSYVECLEGWKRRPILGYGVTGFGFIDGQYTKELVEGGLVGISAFLFLLFSVFKSLYRRFKEARDPFYRGLTLGVLAAFSGLVVHAFGSNTFIIIRIMEPFWFLTAMVMVAPESASPLE